MVVVSFGLDGWLWRYFGVWLFRGGDGDVWDCGGSRGGTSVGEAPNDVELDGERSGIGIGRVFGGFWWFVGGVVEFLGEVILGLTRSPENRENDRITTYQHRDGLTTISLLITRLFCAFLRLLVLEITLPRRPRSDRDDSRENHVSNVNTNVQGPF